MDTLTIAAILISVMFSAFFSGMEIAFVTSNKLKIELDKKQGKWSAKIFSKFVQNQSDFLGTMLVGNNIALVVYGIFMAKILDPIFIQLFDSGAAVLVLQTIASTIIILMTAEYLPKAIFRINSNLALDIFAVPTIIIYYLIYPVVFVIIGLSEFLIKVIFKTKLSEEHLTFGRIDLDNYIKEATENHPRSEELDHEIQIFQNALDFSNVKIRDCMIPRTEIVALEVDSEIEELRLNFIETGLSKILIFKDSIDNIIGYVHSHEIFRKPDKITNILIPIAIMPETMPANDALEVFIKKRKSIAVVVDEYGGTSGIVTMEDVVEEIFGDIEDEHDKEEYVEEKISDNEYRFSSRLETDYLNEEYNLGIPESDEYDTLGGFILSHHEEIPDEGDEIDIQNFSFKITKVDDHKIEEVILRKKPIE